MRNYIHADLCRIFSRIPRMIALIVLFASVGIFLVQSYLQEWNSVTAISALSQYISIIAVCFGLVELINVYGEDFKAKTMQIAIGIGIKRRKVILSKIIETAIVSGVDLLAGSMIGMVICMILKIQFSGAQFLEILKVDVCVWIGLIAYMSLTMIFIFCMQQTTVPMIIYLVLSVNIVRYLIEGLLTLLHLNTTNIGSYLLSIKISELEAQWMLGIFSWKAFIVIAIYIAIGYIVTAVLFKKTELEF